MSTYYGNSCDNALYKIFETDQDLKIHKWHNYFWVYEKYFQKFVEKPVRMLEIGVQHGGSTRMFKKYLGEKCEIIGVDIDPYCKTIEFPDGITIEIGSQDDPVFWKGIVEKYGHFDIILDDGGHKYSEMITTFNSLFDCLTIGGIYLIEETCCQFWEGSHYTDGKDGESFKEFIWRLYGYLNRNMGDASLMDHWHVPPQKREQVQHDTSTYRYVKNVGLYESMLVIEKDERPIPYSELRV